MARKVSINGKLTGSPGVYTKGIELAGPLSVPPLTEGVVALIARSDGPIKPLTPLLVRSARGLPGLGGGNLGIGVDALFNPSRDDRRRVRGATSVIAVRPEAALQASAKVNNSASAALFNFKSVPYGLLAGGLGYQIEAGTSGGPGKKLTIKKVNEIDEVFDDIGFLPPLVIRYSGNSLTASMSITNTQLSVTLSGSQTDGSLDLTADFATYDTINKLAAYINTQTGYEAVVVTNQPDSRKPVDLDYLASGSVKSRSGTIALADTATTSFTSNIPGLTPGTIIKANDEYLYVIAVNGTNGTAIRGYLDSSPAVHTGMAASTFAGLTEVTNLLFQATNNNSARLFAESRSNAAGVPANMTTQAFLTFSGPNPQPIPVLADYKAALRALDGQSFDFLVVDSTDTSVHAEVSKWLAERWGIRVNEVQAHLGAASNETVAQIRTRAKALQDPNMSLWFQNPTRRGTKRAPWLEACIAAGIQAGMAPGTPLTNKSMRVENLEQNNSINIHGDDAETFIEMGASFGRYDGDDFRVVRCLTTYTNDDTFFLISPNVRYAIARVEKLVRSYVKTRHFGKRGVSGDAKLVKATIISALEEAKRQGLIVDGAQREGGVLEDIPAFDPAQIFVERTGNVIEYELAYVPVDGNDFFIGTSRVAEWRDAA